MVNIYKHKRFMKKQTKEIIGNLMFGSGLILTSVLIGVASIVHLRTVGEGWEAVFQILLTALLMFKAANFFTDGLRFILQIPIKKQ